MGSRIGGPPERQAAAGCLLVGGGVLALALLPEAKLGWTLLPQALAGVGMGLALPSLAGGLLPERNSADAARLLTLRHLGIAGALAILAPVVSHNLDTATQRARERGVALVLDAPLSPLEKIKLAPALLSGVESRDPRAGLREAVADHRGDVAGDERAAYDRLGRRADDTLTIAVGDAFRTAFIVTGALALLAALLLVLPPPGLALGAAAATIAAYALLHASLAPEPVRLQDPCKPRDLPSAGGIGGFLQGQALGLLDATACRLHASREELVLAYADEADRKRFQERHGVDPRSLTSILGGLIGVETDLTLTSRAGKRILVACPASRSSPSSPPSPSPPPPGPRPRSCPTRSATSCRGTARRAMRPAPARCARRSTPPRTATDRARRGHVRACARPAARHHRRHLRRRRPGGDDHRAASDQQARPRVRRGDDGIDGRRHDHRRQPRRRATERTARLCHASRWRGGRCRRWGDRSLRNGADADVRRRRRQQRRPAATVATATHRNSGAGAAGGDGGSASGSAIYAIGAVTLDRVGPIADNIGQRWRTAARAATGERFEHGGKRAARAARQRRDRRGRVRPLRRSATARSPATRASPKGRRGRRQRPGPRAARGGTVAAAFAAPAARSSANGRSRVNITIAGNEIHGGPAARVARPHPAPVVTAATPRAATAAASRCSTRPTPA